jgi:predicted O-methyltransferase YrrM
MTADELRAWSEEAGGRLDLWTRLARETKAARVAEIGVYRGRFAARMLDDCPAIETYYMVDPWRNLDDWNKPANTTDETFERFYREAMERTAAHEARRVVLRGTTTEVIDEVPDGSLDLAYVDGDHTLRGITIDLIRVFPKVRAGGWIGGDDFTPSIWQHGDAYEPTLVFPLAVHFAEAVGARIYALPHRQFLIEKTADGDHAFTDLTGRYGDTGLRRQLVAPTAPSRLARLRRRR